MIADRVVLLPGCHVGRRTVMGSGALGKRDAVYDDGSTWMGCGKRNPPGHWTLFIGLWSDNGESICFGRSEKDFDGKTLQVVHSVARFTKAKRIIGYSHTGSLSPPTLQSRPSLLLTGQLAPSLLLYSSVIST